MPLDGTEVKLAAVMAAMFISDTPAEEHQALHARLKDEDALTQFVAQVHRQLLDVARLLQRPSYSYEFATEIVDRMNTTLVRPIMV